MKKCVLIIIIVTSVYSSLKAQVDKNNPIIRKQLELVDLMDEIADKIRLNDLLYKRVALVSFDYPDYIINETEAIQIRSRIEGAFAISGFTIISAPEFKQKPLTIVNGTDSNLTITRQNTLERLILDENKMNEVIDRYALQALMYVQLTYDHITGYQVNIQMVKSRSKELIFSTIINSNPKLYNPRKGQMYGSLGISFYKTNGYFVNNVDISNGKEYTSTCGDVSLGWRQPVNKNQTGFYGFEGGVSVIQLLNTDATANLGDFTKVVPHIGIGYSLCFLKKNELSRKYWVEAFQAMNLYVANNIVPNVMQGITLNATENLSLEVDFRYFLVNNQFRNSTNVLQLQQFGYGVSFIYRP